MEDDPREDGPGDPGQARRVPGTFVGRERELDQLRLLLEDAFWGRGHVALLSGEPGIGKTRLAAELAAHARGRGAQALAGRCHEGEGAPPYWPWVQIVRAYAAERERAALAAEMGTAAGDIVSVVPELRQHLPSVSPPARLGPEAARFRLFDGLTSFLKRAAARRPLLLILDDLHWADPPTLLLLVFLARELPEARLLVVGTCRETDEPAGGPLARALGDLAREEPAGRIALEGLARPDVARFVEQAAGQRPSDALVDAVLEQTGGNPLYLTEIVRLLSSEVALPGAADPVLPAVPRSVRAVIRRRLEPLTGRCRDVLGVAAVLGRQFRLDLLSRAVGSSLAEVVALLDEAVAARIVQEVAGALGTYAFSHALVCETLYESLPAGTRFTLHDRVLGALEAQPGADAILPELAYHALRAVPLGRAEQAVRYATEAGHQAARLLAWEVATGHYATALQALDLTPADVGRRAELLLALGECHRRAGETARARETFGRAVQIVRRTGDGELLARAALGQAGMWSEAGLVDDLVVGVLRDALAAVDGTVSPGRVRLLARLAQELYLREEGRQLAAEAVDLARRLGDPSALLSALHSRHATMLGPESLEERLAVATEIVGLARDVGDPELSLQGHYWRLPDLLEMGDLRAADEALHEYGRLAEMLRQPLYRSRTAFRQAMRALLEGRFDDAETLAGHGLSLGQRANNQTTALIYGVQIWTLRREQGRLEDVEPALRAVIAQYPALPAWRAALACLQTELGRADEARATLEDMTRDDLAALPRDAFWLSAMTLLAEVAAELGHRDRAALLYERLAPLAGRHVVVGRAAAAYYGAVARPLALLASTLERWEAAAGLFEQALDQHTRLGARPWVAHTQREYAVMLLARGRPGDAERAAQLLRLALDGARTLGIRRLEARIVEAQEGPTTASTRHVPEHVFQRDGDYWTLAFAGHVCRLKDAKGLRYLAWLLRTPGRAIHVWDLLDADGAAPPGPAAGAARDVQPLRASRPADVGAALDARARAAYRERLEELRADLDNAERWRDEERALRMREEIEALTRELSSAYQLGGRPRRSGDPIERARKAVANRIRDSLARIQAAHPPLWRHLSATIKTGTFCVYAPERPPRWEI
jgi:tetratricopeptide (TPR) repeat protein